MSKVFISYRRDDSAGYAHAIYRELLQHFSRDRLFMDVDTVEPGVDFVRVIEEAVGECDVFLALIGKRWASVVSGATSRLDNPEDFVRLEISTALARDMRVIPVLVDGMMMPGAETLPDVLKPLSRRNAIEISNTRFNFDVERLITAVRKILDAPEVKRKADEGKERNRTPQEARAQHRAKKERLRQRPGEKVRPKPDEAIERLIKFRQSAKSKPSTVFRDKPKDGSQWPEMVTVPPGTFLMGDIKGHVSEKPVHPVQIPKPFAIGRYEVTFDEYDQFATATGRQLPGDSGLGRGQRPVINVSWRDTVEYTKWLSGQTGKRYRLPSEAEWEYAARSGGKEERWAGTSREQELREYAWYASNSDGKTQSVGSKKPNGLGLYDMSGNVWEWVHDTWHGSYEGAPADGRVWSKGTPRHRMIRGGYWGDVPERVRTYSRGLERADHVSPFIGFRLAQDLD